MAATQRLGHNPLLASEVTDWQAVGENVGEGPTIADLDAAFWASAPHRSNILDPTYDSMGIGSVRRDGTIWIAIVFRDTLSRTSPSTATTWRRGHTRASNVSTRSLRRRVIPAPQRHRADVAQLGVAAVPSAAMRATEVDRADATTVAPRTRGSQHWLGESCCGVAVLLTGAGLRRPRVRAPASSLDARTPLVERPMTRTIEV